jgi:putative ABC transport system substrate-binding protein
VNRREFITLFTGVAAVWSLGARAQQKTMPVIGYLHFASPALAPTPAVFLQGLSETGYVDGQNVAIEFRWAEGRYDRLPALAADLVGRKVDVIAAFGPPAARAAKSATSTIPIVFSMGGDPVADGLVASLARPGGNATGITNLAVMLVPKRLDLLIELVPQTRVVALLVNPSTPYTGLMIRDVQEAARAKRVQLQILNAGTESQIDAAFSDDLHADALIVGDDAFFTSRREQLVALASLHAVPAIYQFREYAAAGGLMSYGSSLAAATIQAGIYAGRILKGVRPNDLPVQQPSKFELVINLKTAKALGVVVPVSLVARADEVIE